MLQYIMTIKKRIIGYNETINNYVVNVKIIIVKGQRASVLKSAMSIGLIVVPKFYAFFYFLKKS